MKTNTIATVSAANANTAFRNTMMTATVATAMFLMASPSASAQHTHGGSPGQQKQQHTGSGTPTSQRHVNIYNGPNSGSGSQGQRHVNIYNGPNNGTSRVKDNPYGGGPVSQGHGGPYGKSFSPMSEHHEREHYGRFVGNDRFGRRLREHTVIRYGRPVIEYVPEVVDVGYAQPYVPTEYAQSCDTCAPPPVACTTCAPPPPPPPPPAVDCGCQTPVAVAAVAPVYAVPTATVVRTRVIVRGHGGWQGRYGRY